MEAQIKVAIIEDLKEVALELQASINEQADMSCTQVYFNAEDAMAFIVQNQPDVVITDIKLPNASGIEAIVNIKARVDGCLFCMFTVFEDDEKIFNSLRAGATGYILKNDHTDKIIDSIRDLANGGSPMSPSIARKVINSFNKPIVPVDNVITKKLTNRENQLLKHLAKGLLYKEIATELSITTGTVKQHIHKIYDKLHVNNRTEAINKYYKQGF